MKPLLMLLLTSAMLAAQAPAPAAAAAKSAPATKKILLTGIAGAVAGAVAGTRALSFSTIAPNDRGAHEIRAGIVYGAIGGVLSASVTSSFMPGEEPTVHNFFWDRWNTPLLAGMLTVHGLDYASTRYFRDRGKDEWLLTNGVVDNRAGFAATEIAAAASGVGLVYLFHRSGHHRLERVIAGVYIGVGVTSAVANYRYPASGHGLFGH
ncbi:MAG TPA: hypothetical protein VN709_04515 [Terriglobales bacterium]|nr:hypothetical protein [Terriglobales bacterium]